MSEMSSHPIGFEDARGYLDDNAGQSDDNTGQSDDNIVDYSGYSQLGNDTNNNQENYDKDNNDEKNGDGGTAQTEISRTLSVEAVQELQFANFNKEEEEKAREEQYQVNNDEIKKIMQEMKWKPKRVMHSLKP